MRPTIIAQSIAAAYGRLVMRPAASWMVITDVWFWDNFYNGYTRA